MVDAISAADGGTGAPGSAVSAQAYLDALAPILARVGQQASGPVGRAADLIVASSGPTGWCTRSAPGTPRPSPWRSPVARAGWCRPTGSRCGTWCCSVANRPRCSARLLERDPAMAHRLYELAPVRLTTSCARLELRGQRRRGRVRAAGQGARAPAGGDHLLRPDGGRDDLPPPVRRASWSTSPTSCSTTARRTATRLLPLPGGGAVCAVSSITAALLAQLVTAEVVRRLLEAGGEAPPVYLSANIPDGYAHNTVLEGRYAGRIRRTA